MDVLNDKIVKTRKPHICSACSRRFEVGSKMQATTVVYDTINTWYSCGTCMELLSKHRKEFDDGCGVCWQNCVDDALERGQTPEELLVELDKAKNKARV